MAVTSHEDMTRLVGTIGYDILDNFVGPAIGAEGIVADLYLADLRVYFSFSDSNDQEFESCENVIKQVFDKYGVDYQNDMLEYYTDMPIALLVLYILEHSNYIEKNE